MKKLITSTIVIASFTVYAFLHSSTNEAATLPVNSSSSKSSSPPSQSSSAMSDSSGSSSNSTSVSTMYKDGTYTGSQEDAFYGLVKVQARIQNGTLTDVTFLEYPNDLPETREINEAAMPMLREEALQAQSAHVDYVTRATDTTIAFRKSLSSALSQAQN